MPNPFFDNRTSPNNVTEPNNPLNDDSKSYSRGFSTFDFGRNFYNTLRYADITPHEVVEAGACKDKIPFGCSHEIRSHTLSSVMMSNIYMKKQYFAVDYRSFLPKNWQKILTKPINGDDIDALKANTTIDGVHHSLVAMCKMFAQDHSDEFLDESYPNDADPWIKSMIRGLFVLECFLSNGSLLSSLGWKGASLFSPNAESFDSIFDHLILECITEGQDFGYISNNNGYGFVDGSPDILLSPHRILEYIRHNYDCELFYSGNDIYPILRRFYQRVLDSFGNTEFIDHQIFNYSRVAAYKMVTSNFFTNDKVDAIYSNHLWLDNMDWIWRQMEGKPDVTSSIGRLSDYEHFYFNDIRCDYDVLSGNRVSAAFYVIEELGNMLGISQNGWDEKETGFYYACQFIHALFSYDSSLRYGDYLTGAKTRPVAIGDTDLVEVGQGVSTLDAIRRFSVTRFLNQVGRVGPRMRDYVKGVLKGVPAPDVTIPRFLASVTSTVSGFEVENTAENQGNIVTLLKSSDSKYIYEVEVGEPCIILGVTTFEVPRVYTKVTDKFFFHEDRYDMYNPFLENTGDQEIQKQERALFTGGTPFAYTGRYMEYKQRVPVASGGFVEFLPAWLFITDNEEGNDTDDSAFSMEIDSDFIRSKNYEMDRFYSSLTGYSLASYFHFIVKYQNSCYATRQMQYNPQLM